jgi:transcriptional regulator with XRE-family HTH domain
MSLSTLAALLDVAEQTVHRWESGKTDVPGPAEMLVRLLYSEQLGNNETVKDALKRIATLEDEIDQMRLTLVEGGNGWQPEPKKAA